MRSANDPNTGLSTTSAPSYTVSNSPSVSREACSLWVKAPRLAAMLCAPNAVTNPAAYNGSSRPRAATVISPAESVVIGRILPWVGRDPARCASPR